MNENLDKLNEYYHQYTGNLSRWLPDGIVEVNLELLHQLGLLSIIRVPSCRVLDRFQAVYGVEKTTFVSRDFIVWIIRETAQNPHTKYVLIALNRGEQLKLESGFSVTGVYNNEAIILRVLEKFLADISETENFIKNWAL